MQFAIGQNGDVYLGDGLGGGSAYAADGTFLGAFTPPNGVTSSTFQGVPYVSTDLSGDVFVFDSKGFHEFNDSSAAPEPSSILLVGVGGLALAVARLSRKSCEQRAKQAFTRPGDPRPKEQ